MLLNSTKNYLIAIGLSLGSCFGLQATSQHLIQKDIVRCRQCAEKRLPASKEKKVYAMILKQAKKSRVAMVGKKGSKSPRGIKSRSFDSSTNQFPKVVHFISEDASHLGDSITIQDGSKWTINKNSREIVKKWPLNTPITFVPNLSGDKPTHKYKVVNLTNGQSVEANLLKDPCSSYFARRIDRLDKVKGEVCFSDGTIWKCPVKGVSNQVFKRWKSGDYIVVGRNDTWFSFQHEDIIINISADNWLPATRVV